jgi:lantibiotic modifying enzyme
MLISAYKLFNNDIYLKSALKAGELVWKKGMLLKGNGICHGITGNAYVLHSLYRITNDNKWLNRSLQFC